jgi:hypothetical protein
MLTWTNEQQILFDQSAQFKLGKDTVVSSEGPEPSCNVLLYACTFRPKDPEVLF